MEASRRKETPRANAGRFFFCRLFDVAFHGALLTAVGCNWLVVDPVLSRPCQPAPQQ